MVSLSIPLKFVLNCLNTVLNARYNNPILMKIGSALLLSKYVTSSFLHWHTSEVKPEYKCFKTILQVFDNYYDCALMISMLLTMSQINLSANASRIEILLLESDSKIPRYVHVGEFIRYSHKGWKQTRSGIWLQWYAPYRTWWDKEWSTFLQVSPPHKRCVYTRTFVDYIWEFTGNVGTKLRWECLTCELYIRL